MIILRSATIHDIPRIADLAVQLYNAELPGMIRGDLAKPRALMRFMLEADNYASLRGRYMAVHDDQVVGMANIRLPSDPKLERLPSGTVRQAITILGWRDALHLFKVIATSLPFSGTTPIAKHAYIHGVIVDETQRGNGYGRQIMNLIEDRVRQFGMAGSYLQVVSGNAPAHNLYQSLGYHVVAQTPAWVDWLGFGNQTLSKLVNRKQ